ncbi:MAG TPA: DUF2867 domain-containing protein, partial [Leeuwenhoekiella sp.]|nr:DUF2867 domain-containing protein [Leeuwenhoekiella sp.]
MKILLTGANGYIGMRLIPFLLEAGHELVCTVRDKNRLAVNPRTRSKISIVEIDFLEEPNPDLLPQDIDAAYYLIHSMTSSTVDFDEKEKRAAENFNIYLSKTRCEQVIYLSGIVNDEK